MRRFLTPGWLGRAALALFVSGLTTPIIYLVAVQKPGRREPDTFSARLDRDDPGWRPDDIVRATNVKLPPDDRNPFVLARAAYAMLPMDLRKHFDDFPVRSESEPNVLLDPAAKAKLVAAMRGLEPALDAARDLADMPDKGGYVIVTPADSLFRFIPEGPELRTIAGLLQADAVLLAEEGKADEAVRSVRAALGTARGMGDDPTLMGQLLRISMGSVAARAAESVINRGEPDRGLAELQAEFLREAATPKLAIGLRGERGQAVQISDLVLGPRPFGQTDIDYLLELMTRYLAVTQLPPERQAAAFAAIPLPRLPDIRYALTHQLLPAIDKACAFCLRSRGELTAVAVGVACERHRRRFGRWPAALADIPADILPAVPTDPCDGLPIKYVRLPGRVVVYSVGPDGVDHGGLVRDLGAKTACDYGIRLYDVALRRQPAPPPAAESLPLPPVDPE